ncbi:hypothetical protein [Paenibacillus sp. CF384]|uniref:hypothetical protein n=1 Tax=Paenibacillus sp. CF384 TaxID=1884382 RepID=UPI00089C270C|nr:hypothetical protein [Paenibacillus sp. CF384]SDW07394.1 hypothetical protein SAMN05518855_1001170 [Paenibacillus sp. CF384]
MELLRKYIVVNLLLFMLCDLLWLADGTIRPMAAAVPFFLAIVYLLNRKKFEKALFGWNES